MPKQLKVPLYDVTHSRAGDKGNTVNISLIPYKADLYRCLLDQVTEARVRQLFAHRGASRVRRYEVPGLPALNFVIEDALQGGVNQSLGLDGHGKALSFLLLTMEIEVPEDLSTA
ncbi:MAG: hypothetical protein AAF441_02430 [Pseudomonadota bacterium]